MEGMTISGPKQNEWIRFKPLPDISATSFVVDACLGRRNVSTDLSLLRTKEFLLGLEEFERSRNGQVILEGTYDFRLLIEPHGGTGAAWIAFHLSEKLWLENQTFGLDVLDADFPLIGEHVGQMVRDFKKLLRNCPS